MHFAIQFNTSYIVYTSYEQIYLINMHTIININEERNNVRRGKFKCRVYVLFMIATWLYYITVSLLK